MDQHRAATDPAFTLATARAVVAGKLRNSRSVLLRGARESANPLEAETLNLAAESLAASLRALPVAPDLDTLRGIEGEAARGYFAALNFIVKPQARAHFALNGRTRRPPAGPIQRAHLLSLLNVDERLPLRRRGGRA